MVERGKNLKRLLMLTKIQYTEEVLGTVPVVHNTALAKTRDRYAYLNELSPFWSEDRF